MSSSIDASCAIDDVCCTVIACTIGRNYPSLCNDNLASNAKANSQAARHSMFHWEVFSRYKIHSRTWFYIRLERSVLGPRRSPGFANLNFRTYFEPELVISLSTDLHRSIIAMKETARKGRLGGSLSIPRCEQPSWSFSCSDFADEPLRRFAGLAENRLHFGGLE